MSELALAISATTRPRRPGEADGRDYWFVSEEEFDRRLAADDFLEWVELPWGPGYRSGTLWSELDRIGDEGHAPLLEIETGGALAVQERIPDAVTDLRDGAEPRCPRDPVARARDRERGRDRGAPRRRGAPARAGTALRHRIVNDDLERALAELEEIVRRELDAAASMSGRDSSSH